MRNKCKIVVLGFVVSCALVVCVLCVPGVGSAGEEKHLDRIEALEARVTALETQVAQLKKSIDQIIAKPQPPTSVDAKLTVADKIKQIQSEAFREWKEAESDYQRAKRDRIKQERSIERPIRSGGLTMSIERPIPSREAIDELETYKKMVEAQKWYRETLHLKPGEWTIREQPQPSK